MDLITLKESKTYPGLFVKKYKNRVFYDNLWNTSPELLESRGHVYDSDSKVVVNPFTKIFNLGENNTYINRDETVLALRKVNGFMCGVTYIPSIDQVVVSTTGSLDSDFVTLANTRVPDEVKDFIRSHAIETEPQTWLFEVVDPSDPHIIVETPGIYLLGARKVCSTVSYYTTPAEQEYYDQVAAQLGIMRPEWEVVNFQQLVNRSKTVHHEGWVVYGFTSKTVLKIKTPFYKVNKMLARKKEILTLDKSKVDEEFYPLLEHVKSLGDQFTNMPEQERLTYMKEWLKLR